MSFRLKATILAISCVFVLLLSTLIILSCYSHSMYQTTMQGHYDETQKHLPKILDDLKSIGSAKVFAPITYNNNAQALIIKHVAWSDAESEVASASTIFFRKHPGFMKSEENYLALIHDEEFKKFDVGWISDLATYDHLDLTTHPKIKKEFDKIGNLGGVDRVRVVALMPLLDFSDLVNEATIYALRKDEGTEADKKEAIKVLHHVAQLLVTGTNRVAQMSAIVALRREVFLSRKFNIELDSGLNEDIIKRLKRLGFSWPGIMQLNAADQLPNEFRPFIKPELMACGAVDEFPFVIMLSDFLKPQWPLEPDFSKQIERSVASQKMLIEICHAKAYLTLLTPIETKNFLLNWETLNIPYVRRIVSSNMMSSGLPNYTKQYDDME
jgi:hypothetical protein